MATIRYGSTANGGKPVWTAPKPISPVDLNAKPPDPPMPTARATIASYQTPVQLGKGSRAVAKITSGTPQQFRWQWMSGNGEWHTGAINPASDLDHTFDRPNSPWDNTFPGPGRYAIRLQTLINGQVVDQTGTLRLIDVRLAPQPPDPEPPDPQPPVPGPGQVLIKATDTSGHPLAGADAWSQVTPTLTVKTDSQGYAIVNATSSGVCIRKDGYHSPGLPNQIETCKVIASLVELALEPFPPPPAPVERVHAPANGPVFTLDNGAAWRMKGITGFKLAELWRTGGNWEAFLDAYPGFNTVRVFSYVEGPNWTDPTWNSPSPSQCVDFVRACNAKGWYVWWVLLTSSSPARVQHALDEIAAFTEAKNLGLFLQGANEPERQNPDRTLIDTSALHGPMAASGYPWDNGYSDDTRKHQGTFYDWHSKRDQEWPRRCHDLMDIYSPPADAPSGTVAMKMPIVAGEPAKYEDVGFSMVDWKGYFGGCAIFGAGAAFHSKTGKFCQLPTSQEKQLAAAALMGLNAFPAEAAKGTYGRIDGDGLRTYKKTADSDFHGNCMVRIRPNHPTPAPESGWTSLEADGVLWKK